MPGGTHPKTTGKRGQYSHADLSAALERVQAGESIRAVADETGIPRSTLGDKKRATSPTKKTFLKCGRQTILPGSTEDR